MVRPFGKGFFILVPRNRKPHSPTHFRSLLLWPAGMTMPFFFLFSFFFGGGDRWWTKYILEFQGRKRRASFFKVLVGSLRRSFSLGISSKILVCMCITYIQQSSHLMSIPTYLPRYSSNERGPRTGCWILWVDVGCWITQTCSKRPGRGTHCGRFGVGWCVRSLARLFSGTNKG